MHAFSGRLTQAMVGLYAWMVTVLLGAVWLDRVYSRQLPGESLASGEAADLILLIGGATLLAGLAAVALAWQANTARVYFVASLAVLSLEFLGPVLLAPFLPDTPGAGAGLRIAIHMLASLLAFIGLGEYTLQRRTGKI